MAKRKISANKIFNRVLRYFIKKYLKNKFNVHISSSSLDIKPPYVIIGNHTNFWDPFLIGSYVHNPVYFVTSDEYFRNPLLNIALRLVGAIPKTKFLSDYKTVKDILTVKKNNGIIGIFPEGKRNWDGKTAQLLYPTAKLIKSLKIPVVSVLMKGAYLSYPRWAKSSRKGKISIDFSLILNPKEISAYSVDDIYKVMSLSLEYNEYEYQKNNRIPFEGKNLAENLELLIFICPHCKSIGKLKSIKDTFICSDCGYSVIFDKYGFLKKVNQDVYFNNVSDWNIWQLKFMRELILRLIKNNECRSIFEDQNVILLKGLRMKPLKKFRIGSMYLYTDKFIFISHLKETIIFDFDKIHGLNIQFNNKLEFYYNNVLNRFTFNKGRISAYKWVEAILILKELKHN